MDIKPIWSNERIEAWKADARQQCEAAGVPMATLLRTYGDLPYAIAEEYEAELADLRAKLNEAMEANRQLAREADRAYKQRNATQEESCRIADYAGKMMETAQSANLDLTNKLAAAQAELHDLRIRAGLAAPAWQPLTEGEPVHCTCCDDDCNTEAWIEQGILCLEDADGMRVSFDLGEDYAFMRRAK